MSRTPQDKRREQPKKGAPRGENKRVTVIVVTAFIATVISASAVLLLQRVFESDPSPMAQLPPPPQAAPAPVQPKAGQKFAYYDFPKLTVFLKNTNARSPALANIRVTAEFVSAESLPVTKAAQPRIVDAMQSFLRGCSREDLDGRAGTELLRRAFLDIVNDAIDPHQANTVLFKEIVIQ